MLANLASVVGETAIALRLVRRLEGVEIGRQRRFRVDDDVLAARNADDEIGSERSIVRRRRGLDDVVAVLHHSGVLDDVAQLRFSPAPTHMRGAQRVGELSSALGEGADLDLERAVRLLPDALDALELEIHACERVLQRTDVAGEMRLGQLEESCAVGVQRLGRECLDGRFEPLVERSTLDGELRLCSRERTLEHDHFLDASAALEKGGPHGDEDGEAAGRETDEKGSDDH